MKIMIATYILFSYSTGQQLDYKQYYTNLITTNIKQANTFDHPTGNEEYFENSKDRIKCIGSYDFIIVGAGTSGSVVASRLSERSDWNILLLEAGGQENEFSQIPAMQSYLENSTSNWDYPAHFGSHDGHKQADHRYFRGKGLGGSSSVGHMIYTRGNKNDFNTWENMGNAGWGYNDVLPYFEKSENIRQSENAKSGGHGGTLNIEHEKSGSELWNIFSEAAKMNNQTELDYHEGNLLGFGKAQYTRRNGKRLSIANAYLRVASYRKNLRIITNVFVSKLLLRGNITSGVFFYIDGQKHLAIVRREVILCAGAINTPQILIMSGIGPKEDLEKLKIRVATNLPVGKRLQDQATFTDLNFRTNISRSNETLETAISSYTLGLGPLTIPLGIEGVGFVNTKDPYNKTATPDIQYVFKNLLRQGNLDESAEGKTFEDFGITLKLLHPRSEGRVFMKSSKADTFPNLELNYYGDPYNEDIETMYAGILFVMDLVRSNPFQRINTTLIPLPYCKKYQADSRSFWLCAIQNHVEGGFDAFGTTRMGSFGYSVVDSTLRVHGISRLRIADCGILPTSISGGTMAVAIMIGEKLSDMIKTESQYTYHVIPDSGHGTPLFSCILYIFIFLLINVTN